MVIDRTSWHYKVQHELFKEEAKSLCSYFWHVMAMVFIIIPFASVLLTLVCIFFNLIVVPIAALFGCVPVAPLPWCYNDEQGKARRRYSGKIESYGFALWRPRFHLFTIFGVEIYPAYVILPPLCSWFFWANDTVRYFSIYCGIIISIVVCVAALIVALILFMDSEIWRLTKAWVKAKKDGVCPLIEYVGEKPQDPIPLDSTEF